MGSVARGPSGQAVGRVGQEDPRPPCPRKVSDFTASGSEQIAAAKHIAAAKSVGYQTQLRMWIAEGIRREAKRA
jgi:hypothetical protein